MTTSGGTELLLYAWCYVAIIALKHPFLASGIEQTDGRTAAVLNDPTSAEHDNVRENSKSSLLAR